MKILKVATLFFVIAGLTSVASASIFFEDFESYAAGSAIHGQGGWAGWENTPGAGAPVSNAYAYSGSNSIEVVSSADLVHTFDVTGGIWLFTAMQYIPSGTEGISFFILLNTYQHDTDDGRDWSVQTKFDLAEGTINSAYLDGPLAQILYDTWVELKYIINLDENTVDVYYDGEFIFTHQWDGDEHDTLQAIDLYGNSASSIYYDDIKIEATPYAMHPQPENGTTLEATWVTLKWAAGGQAVSHDVYVGEDFDEVNEGVGDTFRGNQTANYYVAGFPGFAYPDGLVPGTTYYWRIDEINDEHPDSPWKGDVWSFFVPPLNAYNPEPADGTEYIIPDDVTLSWDPGFGAMVHYVYFGDNYDEINDAVSGGVLQPGTTSSYSVGQLEMDKQYYWRIDEFDGINTRKGDIWTFSTLSTIAVTDPNLVAWWKLDEAPGTTAVDWSGHDHHGTFEGDAHYAAGYVGQALALDGNGDYVNINGWPGLLGAPAITATAWIKTSNTGTGAILGWGPNTAGQRFGFRHNESRLRFEHHGGNVQGDTHMADDEWHHAAVTIQPGVTVSYPGVTLWLDGQDDTRPTTDPDPVFDLTAAGDARIGTRRASNDRFFNGLIDDVRIYDRVLTREEIQTVMRVDPSLAWGPSPKDGSIPDIERALPLTWSAGDGITQHDVYFGTDLEAVDNADSTDTTGIYRGRQGITSYTPPEGVEWGSGPYFWRIDEVGSDGTPIKGRLLTFSIADFILVDDFESYTNDDVAGEAIWQSWIDGFGASDNGAQVGYLLPPYTEHAIVNSGVQSMPLTYNNATGITNSEAVLTLTASRDWTQYDLTNLSIWFRGDSANAVEPLYVAVSNTVGAAALASQNDPSASQTTTWTEWIIPLQTFADQGIDLTNVDQIAIGLGTKANPAATGGLGTMYIDDIRLYPQ
jgi:hypothetical protein